MFNICKPLYIQIHIHVYMCVYLNIYLCLNTLQVQRVKCLPAMWETSVRSLGWEDPLEKEMAAHSNILAWRIPWMEEPGRLQSMGSQRGTLLSDFFHFQARILEWLAIPFSRRSFRPRDQTWVSHIAGRFFTI